jgi:hypothetical protein
MMQYGITSRFVSTGGSLRLSVLSKDYPGLSLDTAQDQKLSLAFWTAVLKALSTVTKIKKNYSWLVREHSKLQK